MRKDQENIRKDQEDVSDALLKEACKAFSIQDKYVRLSRYVPAGEIIKKTIVVDERKKKRTVRTPYTGKMVIICTAGGERARYLRTNNGKTVVEVRGIVVIHDSGQTIKPLRKTRITGIPPEKRTSDSGY